MKARKRFRWVAMAIRSFTAEIVKPGRRRREAANKIIIRIHSLHFAGVVVVGGCKTFYQPLIHEGVRLCTERVSLGAMMVDSK